MDHQQVLVDQIGGHQRGDQNTAAHDHEVRASVVERVLERAALGVPGRQQILVGAPPEQKRAILPHPFTHLGDHRLVAAPDRPAAAVKSIPRVLVRAAWSLQHAVKRQLIHDDYLSHLISCPFGLGSATQMRRLGIPETRVIPASHPLHERDRPKSTSPPNWQTESNPGPGQSSLTWLASMGTPIMWRVRNS